MPVNKQGHLDVAVFLTKHVANRKFLRVQGQIMEGQNFLFTLMRMKE